jgi:Tol biopolymer transport system component
MRLSSVAAVFTLTLFMGVASSASAAAQPAGRVSSAPAQSLSSPSPSGSPVSALDDPWIAYQGATGGPPRIRLVRPDGTDDHAVVPDIEAGDQFHPDWSPDGLRLAFAADDADGTRDV